MVQLVKILDEHPESIRETTLGGSTPLHLAVGINNIEITQLLISRGADVNAKTKEGFTPLHWAAYMNAGDTTALLLQNGADPDIKTLSGRTALEIAKTENSFAVVQSLTQAQGKAGDEPVKPAKSEKTEKTPRLPAAPASAVAKKPQAVAGQNLSLSESDMVKLGKDAVRQENFKAAYEIFTKLLRQNPTSEEINFNYAMTCYKLGDYSRARMAFERVVDLNPSNAKSMTMIGVCNFNIGQFDLARKNFEKALGFNPPDQDRQNINSYLVQIEKGRKRLAFNTRADFGYFNDSNVNVGPDSDIINIAPIIFGSQTIDTLSLDASSQPISSGGYFTSLALSGTYDHGDKGKWASAANVAYFQNWIDQTSQQESKFTQLSAGMRYLSGRSMFQMPLKIANINSGHKSLMNLYGVSPAYVSIIGANGSVQLATSASVESRDYDTLNDRDGVFVSAGESVKKSFGQLRHNVSAGLTLSHDYTDKAVYEYNGISLLLGATVNLPMKASVYSRLKYTMNDYKERETLAPETRADDQIQYVLGINKSINNMWGFDLNHQTTDNNCSFKLYEYSRNVTTLSTFIVF